MKPACDRRCGRCHGAPGSAVYAHLRSGQRWVRHYCCESPYHRGGLEIGFLDDPQWHNFTRSKSAHQEVVGVLDQACAIWGLAGGDGRSRFIQRCLRYGLLPLLDAGVLELPEAAEPKLVCHYREMEARLSAAGALRDGATDAPGIHGIQKDLPTSDGVVPAVAGPASVVAGASGIRAAICAAGSPRQNAFESSGLVLRNPIRFLSILAISGIACSSTSPASTPAATDFNRASCPGLKSRCFSGLGCRTSGSPQPHRQTGFWNHVPLADCVGLPNLPRPPRSFYPHWCSFANLRLSLNTLRCSRAMFSDGYG